MYIDNINHNLNDGSRIGEFHYVTSRSLKDSTETEKLYAIDVSEYYLIQEDSVTLFFFGDKSLTAPEVYQSWEEALAAINEEQGYTGVQIYLSGDNYTVPANAEISDRYTDISILGDKSLKTSIHDFPSNWQEDKRIYVNDDIEFL